MITFDSVTLKAFIEENQDFLTGARIQKIQQPTRREFVFSLRKDGETRKFYININPQHYSPRLNAALEKVLEYDNKEHWATTTVGQLESDIKIFMGPRWNASNIKLDNPTTTDHLVPYLTANNVLELRRFKMKWIDPALADEDQIACMKMLKVKQGDILISRSGTVGRMTYATEDLAKNYLVSDDLVRVRVKDDDLRAYLVAYFCSETALKLMLLDEYGSVQQHLQPRHIQQLIIPVPDEWNQVKEIIAAGKKFMAAMEAMSIADKKLRKEGFDNLCK